MAKIHLKKYESAMPYLLFSVCGRYEHKSNVEWKRQLTSDPTKVTCELCKKRLWK